MSASSNAAPEALSPSPMAALPRLIAHRGLSASAPENTLAAVRAAHEAGITWVELDVQLLADGTPVIWHDATLKRCSNGRGRLAKLSLAEARRLDVGAWFDAAFTGERMATLDEMLALIDTLSMGLNLELKLARGRDPAALAEAAVPRAMAKLPTTRLIVSSFSGPALEAARGLEPDPTRLRLGRLYDKIAKGWEAEARSLEAFSVHGDWTRLTEARARAIKAAGYRLICYTANDPEAFAPLWQWGVDAAISDDPRRFCGRLPDAV
ncbi:glycerophosphoryl diester phosphodiesterase [Onishia taeanensis]|uniref:Glycerophosphoryl diester phosphodiesterase n=1 Tax=Onishia taeanensis TaxID=284577 RepID=A0A1G7RIP9_9GAMM|nr:glycerophosphoryl diester phosphodiesterase [Halomonas taeanensis]SDG09890.1 glycerophosphoryl diester phosphodiesterase [Halomonas taeanensis]